jgi:uncharacterized protein YbjT (DUF2867 family)
VTTVWPTSIGPDGSYYAPAGAARISMTDARDVAAVAARALQADGHAGKAYDVTGPAALSHGESCEKLAARLGRPVRYVPVDDEAARSAMLGAGLNRWLADALIELYQDYRRSGTDGYAARIHETVQEVTGVPPRTLSQVLADDLARQ